MNAFVEGLDRNHANYAPLTPLSLLARTASVWPERIAIIHGDRRTTWREVDFRSRRLAGATEQLFRHERSVTSAVALYWHFMGILWIALFGLLYLWS